MRLEGWQPPARLPECEKHLCKKHLNPLDYNHKYKCLGKFAQHLNLKAVRLRTVQTYYRQMRLVADHSGGNPRRFIMPADIRSFQSRFRRECLPSPTGRVRSWAMPPGNGSSPVQADAGAISGALSNPIGMGQAPGSLYGAPRTRDHRCRRVGRVRH